jgi:hypothetical protein
MNDCACILVDSYDSPAFYNAQRRKARKDHICDECGCTITPGNVYENATGKWDGCLDTFKCCSDCLSIRDSFFCDGYLHGGLWEYLSVHISDMNGVSGVMRGGTHYNRAS